MSMKKILTLFLILLTASFAASSAPALTVSEGNIDGLTLYSPQGTKIDSLTDIGESGMGRYHGKESFYTFSHARAVLRNTTRLNPGIKFAPFAGKLHLIKRILR